jgi:hypothetical protein
MTVREKQSTFLMNVSKLIQWAFANGFELTGGELLRPKEMQTLYVQQGKSKTMDSKHLDKLAIDLNLFINGVYQTDTASYKPLADFWQSLNPANRAGYYFTSLKDGNHFEMT